MTLARRDAEVSDASPSRFAGTASRGSTAAPAGAEGRRRDLRSEIDNGRVSRYSYLDLSRCETHIGYDVRVSRLSCERAQLLEGVLVNLRFNRHPRTPGEDLVYGSKNYPQASGWTCWGQLVRREGPIRYVCLRGHQALLFKFG